MQPPGYSKLKGATIEPADHLLFSQEDGVSISQEIGNEGIGTFAASRPPPPFLVLGGSKCLSED